MEFVYYIMIAILSCISGLLGVKVLKALSTVNSKMLKSFWSYIAVALLSFGFPLVAVLMALEHFQAKEGQDGN